VIVPHRNVLEKVASHQRSGRGVRVSPPCTPPASPGIVRSRSPAERAPSSASIPHVRLQQSASPASAATSPSSIQDSLYLVSSPDQGGRGEVSSSSSQLELLPSRNCRLQTSPAPSNLGSPCLYSSSPRPPARLGGASPGGLSGVSPRPPTPPPPPFLTHAHASPVHKQRPSLSSLPLKRQDALANSFPDQHAPLHPLDCMKDFHASETKSSATPNRDFKTHVPNSSESQQRPWDCRAESPLSVPCLKQRQYSPLPRLEGVDWGLPKAPPRPSPRKSPQPYPPSSTPGSPSFPRSLLATLARAKQVVGRGGQSPNLQNPPSDLPSQQTNIDTRRQPDSQQRPDSLASQSPSPKVTEWRQRVERVRRQSQTSPLASPLSSPFASPLTSPKQSHSGPRQGRAGGLGHIQGAGSPMPEQLELAMSTTSSPRMRKDKQGRARAQLARGKRPTSSSRESFVFIGCDGAVLARSGPDNERPVVRRVRMEGGSCQEVIASPKDEDREMERIQASHRLRQISEQLEATKCLRPDQMREVPFYPCNPYNQPCKEVKPRPISLVTFPSPPNSPRTFHTPPTSSSTAMSARKRQVASKACAEESEGRVLQKVQPPKVKQAGVQPSGGGAAIQPAAGLPPTKTNLKLMTVLSNSCTVFTGQVDCDNLITPQLPVRKISHDLPYQACSEQDARRDFSKRNTVYKK